MPIWRIQSLAYPNPLADGQTEWDKFEKLISFDDYDDAKQQLTPGKNQKTTAVETLKASAESFGLLWVRPDGKIEVTPGGRQYVEAVTAGDAEEVAWVGLNLLIRCPLSGPRLNWAHPDSDLPIYWGLMAVMLDAGGQLYWEELGRVVAHAGSRADLAGVVAKTMAMRNADLNWEDVAPPADHYHGDLYNRLNVAMHHLGLGRLLTENAKDDLYVDRGARSRRVDRLLGGWKRDLVEATLGGAKTCEGLTPTAWVDRVPAAFDEPDIETRFAILGAAVPPRPADVKLPVQSSAVGGDLAWMVDPAIFDLSGLEIFGPPVALCSMAPGQRVVLRHHTETTYMITSKQAVAGGVKVGLRRARRITNPALVEAVFKEIHGT